MATASFKETVILTAKELYKAGKISEDVIDKYGVTVENFRSTLKDKWFDSTIMMEATKIYGQYSNYVKEIQDNVKSLNLTDCVSFLGQRTDVNELMMGMDAFFLPSLFEGFPIVSIEAQASGLPVFMSDTISKEVEITDLVHWLSIDKGPECWLLELEKCSFSRNRSLYADEVKKRGFDVQTSSVLLQKIYLGDADEIDR